MSWLDPAHSVWHCGEPREPENAWHLSAIVVLSSQSVSHSGESWLCSQDAPLPHGGLFLVGWRRCLTLAPGRILSWSRLCPAAQQLWMLLLWKQVYVDITWTWNDPQSRPKSRYANDLTFQKPGKQCQLPAAWCRQVREPNMHTHVWGRQCDVLWAWVR